MDINEINYLLLDRESGNAYCVDKKNNKIKIKEPKYHSENFNWGFNGSGPADLAFAICKLLGKEEYYQDFKWMTISKLDIKTGHKLFLSSIKADLDFIEKNKKKIEALKIKE